MSRFNYWDLHGGFPAWKFHTQRGLIVKRRMIPFHNSSWLLEKLRDPDFYELVGCTTKPIKVMKLIWRFDMSFLQK